MSSPSPRARPAATLLAGIVVLATQSGCTGSASSSTGSNGAPREEPRYGGAFHMMLEAPGTLDPSRVDDVYEACIVNQISDGLLEFDLNLNPVPAIAREWSISRDGTEYVFTLREGVRFHNGRLVEAEDFVYSFTRIFDPERADHGLGGEYLRKIDGVQAYVEGAAEGISGLAALDRSTLRIRLEAPYGSFLSALAMDQTKVVPREEIERWADEYDRHPCGTGPFRFDRFVEDPVDPRIVLIANDGFFRGRPYLDEVVFHVPKDFNVDRGADALLAGDVSMCDLPGGLKERFESDPRFQLIRRPELSMSFFGINIHDEPLTDVRVRRAIAHAIDRDRIMDLDPVGRIPATGILPPGMFGYSPDPKVLAYDPDESRRLLAEAGYPGGEGLPSFTYWQADRGEVGRKADAHLKEDLAAVGIDIRFEYAEWDVFDQLLTDLAIPAFGLTWVADVPDPDSFLASLFMTTGVYNLFEYSCPEVDSLLVTGSEMRSSLDRSEVYRRAERIILNEVPIIPLFHVANNFAVRAEVHGLTVTPFGLGNLAMERIWIRGPAS